MVDYTDEDDDFFFPTPSPPGIIIRSFFDPEEADDQRDIHSSNLISNYPN